MSWVLPEKTDPLLAFSFEILGHILIGTPASPLRKALIDSGLGEDLTGLGLESAEHRESVVLHRSERDISSRCWKGTTRSCSRRLRRWSARASTREMIEAALNTVEFNLREHNTGALPQGLDLMIRIMTTWLYDGDPLLPVRFDRPFQVIKEKLQTNERYFEDLIRQFLLENDFRADVLMIPDAGVTKEREQVEKARLEKVQAGLMPSELDELVKATRRLKQRQETPDTPEALASLPVLKLEDLDKKIKTIPLVLEKHKGVDVLVHDIFTNSILYLDLGFDLTAIAGGTLAIDRGIWSRAVGNGDRDRGLCQPFTAHRALHGRYRKPATLHECLPEAGCGYQVVPARKSHRNEFRSSALDPAGYPAHCEAG